MAVPVGGVFGAVRMVRATADVERLARRGADDLRHGGQAMLDYDATGAQQAFSAAAQSLAAADEALRDAAWSQTRIVSRLPFVGKKYRTGLAAVGAAREIARAGSILAGSLVGVERPTDTGVTIKTGGITQASVGILGPMLRQPQSFRQGLDALVAALDQLATIESNNVPSEYRETVRAFQQVKPYFTTPAGRGDQLADVLTALFAGDVTKEFLLVFQNHDELRPTGGFIGTFMMVKFEQGVFKVLDAPVTGPFDLSAQNPKTALPPQPLLAVAPYWTFHDANWFLDVPTSSEFLLDFYAQARGFKPDGIIYLTPGLVESLLRITGPLRPDGYGVDISAENFVRATEEQVEFHYDKALNNPKKFLLDLVPTLITALAKLDAAEAMLAAGVTLQHADQADLLLYSRDESAQSAIATIGWSGRLLETEDDYLAVVNSNLGGGKTDRVIDYRIEVTVMPEAQGLLHEVKIIRRHNGETENTLTRHTNRSFIRVYAPASAQFVGVSGARDPAGFFMPGASGAELTPELMVAEGSVLMDQASGVRITGESGRKTFGAWSELAVGETQTLTFSYTTPLPTDGRWALVWQKQPGVPQQDWQLTFKSGEKQRLREVVGDGKITSGRAMFTTTSDQHRALGVVLEEK